MKFRSVVLLAASLALGACSSASNLLDTKQLTPQGQVATNNPLSLPPDLQLPPPGTAATAAAYQSPAVSAPLSPAPKTTSLYGGTQAPAKPDGDVFDQNGISKIRPDGTAKTPAELNQELSAVYMARKKAKNPSYGTIANIGAIFQDN